MGFVRIFLKNNIQDAHLPKTSIVGQIVSEVLWDISLVMLWWLQANPSNFDLMIRPIQCLDPFIFQISTSDTDDNKVLLQRILLSFLSENLAIYGK